MSASLIVCEYPSKVAPGERIRVTRRGMLYLCSRIRNGRTVPNSQVEIGPAEAALHRDYARSCGLAREAVWA